MAATKKQKFQGIYMTDRTSILAADVGGTNARFAYLTHRPTIGWDVDGFKKVRVADFDTFEHAMRDFVGEVGEPATKLAICAAGVVIDNKVKLTNADWTIDGNALRANHGLRHCRVVNDFAAMTRSIPELDDAHFQILKPGTPDADAPIVVAGPGTGFGVGYLIKQNKGLHVLTTEGGHKSYAPVTDLELALLKALQKQCDYVSLEVVSSGSGLPGVHRAMCEIHGKDYVPLAPGEIAELAIAGDPLCRDIVDVRACATIDAMADLVLVGGAQGGAILAGGVSGRMVDFFKAPAPMARFIQRGPRTEYMERVPLSLLDNPNAPLIGAAALLEDMATL